MENRYGVKNPNKGVIQSLHESPRTQRVYASQVGAQKTQDKLFLMNPSDLAGERGMTTPGGGSLSKQLFGFGQN
jgi:hypothetical protein